MSEDQDTGTCAERRDWVRPEIKRLEAGAAETGPSNTFDTFATAS